MALTSVYDLLGRYMGETYDESCTGKGTCIWDSGEKYTGDWYQGRPHGQGLLERPDQLPLEGTFLNGRYIGKITIKDKETNRPIKSLEEAFHSTVQIRYKNGDVYTGTWFEGHRNGYGKLTHPNRPPEEGLFINDKFIVKTSSNVFGDDYREFDVDTTLPNMDRYIGHMVNGKPDGYGTYLFYDFSSPNKEQYTERYTGTWVNGKRSGKNCHYTYRSGLKYNGDFYDDYYEGFGELLFPDGGLFRGLFKRGLREGEGTQKFPDGTYCVGNWLNNLRDGDFTFYFRDFGKVIITYSKGIPSTKGLFYDNDGTAITFSCENDCYEVDLDKNDDSTSCSKAIYDFCFVLSKDILFQSIQSGIHSLLKLSADLGYEVAKRTLPRKQTDMIMGWDGSPLCESLSGYDDYSGDGYRSTSSWSSVDSSKEVSYLLWD